MDVEAAASSSVEDTPVVAASAAAGEDKPKPQRPTGLRESSLRGLKADPMYDVCSFLDRPALYATMQTCRALQVVCDADTLWIPITAGILSSRLCLDESIIREFSELSGVHVSPVPNANYKPDVEAALRSERERFAGIESAKTRPHHQQPAAELPDDDGAIVEELRKHRCESNAALATRRSDPTSPVRRPNNSADSRQLGRGRCRQLLGRAFGDAKRRIISVEEIARFRWHMRMRHFKEMRPFINQGSLGPDDAPPIYVHFEQNYEVFTEVHPYIGQWQSVWEWVPAAQGYLPATGGDNRPAFVPDEARADTDFSCLHWRGRPPLRVWRHPKNWHVLMTHIHLQYGTYELARVGQDPVLDDDVPYVHPILLGHSE